MIWLNRLYRKKRASNPRLSLLLWASLIALIVGAFELGRPVEDHLRMLRNSLRSQSASGDIVIIAIDDESLARLNKWPWPRRLYGQLAENLTRMGAKRIFFDLDFSSTSNPEDDRLLTASFERTKGKVTVANLFSINPMTGERTDIRPLPQLRKHAHQANINLRYEANGAVWQLPYSLTIDGSPYPSFASDLAEVEGGDGELFPIDHSIKPTTIPTISAADIIEGKAPAASIKGKDVVIGAASTQLGDIYLAPGYGLISGVYLHVLGAETLRHGRPLALGWLLPFLLSAALALGALTLKKTRLSLPALGAGIFACLAAPLLLEERQIVANVFPSLLMLVIVTSVLGWRNVKQLYRKRAATNPISGLPNFNALREENVGEGQPLIAARVQNFAEITSSLPADGEKTLVEQIAARLALSAGNSRLYQGDEGIFVWFADPQVADSAEDHLSGLHSLFRSPVVVESAPLDLTITFGIDRDFGRSLANRLGSALVAADEAAAEGLKWKQYDPAKLKDAAWKLSLLSQLDAAIDAGQLWIAYQPKLDLATRAVVGAEALVRWTHPEKGPISPVEFIIAAEQSDRIRKLTDHVLEGAIRAAAAVNARGICFGMSVNLSARLIGDTTLPATVAAMLEKHQLSPECLTLEVTETAALATGGTKLEALLELRAMGVKISIDDYGTGLSTLEYLKRIPASEIKIDKSFVQSVEKSQSDRLMVQSTIQLAHSLGQTVVAEGVEHAQTLEALASMGCDLAQGYYIGRPMTFRALARRLFEERLDTAA